MNKVLSYLKNPRNLIFRLKYKKLTSDWGKKLSDEEYLSLVYKLKFGKKLDLASPKTFNEKLQWLKLYDRKPIYTTMVDKYEAKKYVADIIGEEYIIPTLGVWDKFDDIDFDTLPEQFVLKTTHDSGGIVICRDKKTFDKEKAKQKIEWSLKREFYYLWREWPYKNVKPRIIAEKYMVDESGFELKDYKIFCFGGEPKLVQVDFDRFSNHKRNVYSADWELLELTIQFPRDPNRKIEKPKKLEEMMQLACILSAGIPHIRIDFYSINDQIYFGELTFFHGSGYEEFSPREWDYTFGSWIELPQKKTADIGRD